ncbi:MAG TPA: arsenic resistance N-acetyltransferase ArsN2 [Thermoanaerobaculia bacterium]|nr:arsenic resistance N-acetyltransferase ArsN2 [Thermoanaerobaculia bacterium]
MPDLEALAIRGASLDDLDDVIGILLEAGLPIDGLSDHIRTFVVAHEGERIVGCAGAEAYPFAALIRSVAVAEEYRRAGLGRRLVREVLDRLASHGLREFYLLTSTAEDFFRKRGFKPCDRDEVNPQLMQSTEFTNEVCASAVCMRLVMR